MAVLSPAQLLGIADLRNGMRLSVLQGLLVLAWSLPGAVLPVQALDLLGDAQAVSLFFFGIGFAGLVGVLSAPWLIYMFGRRFTLWLGTGLLVVSSVCLSLEDTGYLIAGGCARAAGFMIIDVVFEIIVMESIPRRAMGRFEAARVFCLGVAVVCAPWLGVRLSLEYGDWATYGVIGLTAVGICLYILYSGVMGKPRTTAERPVPPNVFRFIRRFSVQPRLRLAWLLSFGRAGWWTMFFIYVPIYCVENGLGEELGGLVLSLASVPLLLVPLWARLGQKIGMRNLLAFAYLSTGIVTLSVAFAVSPWVGVTVFLVGGLCASLLDAIGNALFLRAARPLERPEMASVFFTYREMAQLAPPGVLSVVLGFFALPGVFLFSGVAMSLLTWFTRYIPKRF